MLRRRHKRVVSGAHLLGSIEPVFSCFSDCVFRLAPLRRALLCITFLILITILSFRPSMAERVVPSNREVVHLSYAPVVAAVAPAVVNIYTQRRVSTNRRSLFNDPFFAF